MASSDTGITPTDTLPRGTVTLLFSDVEGSTRLVHSLGDRWPEVLLRQRELCREAWAAHGGHELGTEGDSFLVVFETAAGAVRAAVAAQRAIEGEGWHVDGRVRIRIGLHTGSPQRLAEGYAGMDLHRGARVGAAAHGGQILVSESTAALARAQISEDVELRDLGLHSLKDIPEDTRIYQVVAPGLDERFPPIRSLGGAGSLPTLLTPTVGRDGELAELEGILTGGARLLTLTGPGGTGKTRLAVALAQRVAGSFPDGVYFVGLESVTTASLAWPVLAGVLDLPADGQVPPEFFDHVRDRRSLLVLDNLEQIPDAHELVRELLQAAPHLTLVTTSRSALHVEGESLHDVPPLEPDGSFHLFVDHATRANSRFRSTGIESDIARLCAALDHLPLALEIAAARVRMLSPAAILAKLDSTLDLTTLDRSRSDRMRTLRGAIEWSYQLLPAGHRELLDHLGVFEGGADLDAVEAVAGPALEPGVDVPSVLFDLIDASLVRVVDGDGPDLRFTLLETIKRFARDQLSSDGRSDVAQQRHAQHFYEEAAAWHARTTAAGQGLLSFLDREAANLRLLARHRSGRILHPQAYGDDPVPPRHVLALLSNLARLAKRPALQGAWAVEGLAVEDDDPIGEAALLAKHFQCQVLDLPWSVVGTDEALSTFAEIVARAEARPGLPPWVDLALADAFMTHVWAWTAAENGEIDRGRSVLRAWRPRPGCDERMARRLVLGASYAVAYYAGEYDEARVYQRELLSLLDPTEAPRGYLIGQRNHLAWLDVVQGRWREAQEQYRNLVADLRDDDNPLDWIDAAENFADAIGRTAPLLFARVQGMNETFRVVEAFPELDQFILSDEDTVPFRALVTKEEWEAAYTQGRSEDMFDLLREMAGVPLLADDRPSTAD